jgi:hypothetical protein
MNLMLSKHVTETKYFGLCLITSIVGKFILTVFNGFHADGSEVSLHSKLFHKS